MINHLDSSRDLADQFAKIGVVIAAVACVVAPLSLLVGVYGMNIKEITGDAANVTLYEFLQVGLPLVLFILVCGALFATWVSTTGGK